MRATCDHVFFMDPMRGILMALGVLLHSAQVFNAEKSWLIYSEASSTIAEHLVMVIHLFRMPAFFIVSGFFTLLTLGKYGPKEFLKLRMERVLVPLVVVALTINSLQAWILAESGWRTFTLTQYLLGGQWISHLWFLVYLLVFFVLSYSSAHLARFIPRRVLISLQSLLITLPLWVVLLVMPVYYLALLTAAKLFPALYRPWLGVLSLYDLFYFLQFFCFGIVLCAYRPLFKSFTELSVTKTGFLLVVWLFAFFCAEGLEYDIIKKIAQSYSAILVVWIGCHFVFSLFKKYGDRPSTFSMFTASVSYTVYLFHHVLVIVFGLLLIQLNIGGTPGLILLASSVLLTTVLIDLFVISRYSLASYLFNGVRVRGRPYSHVISKRSDKRNSESQKSLPHR